MSIISRASTVTTKDFSILESLLHGTPAFPGAAILIRRKLHVARVVFGTDIAADLVTLNSRVRYRAQGGRPEERILVLGVAEEISGLTLPLNSPRGLALIGTMAGETIETPRCDGSLETLVIEEVLYQPEAHSGMRRRADAGDMGTISILSAHRMRRAGRRLPIDEVEDDPGPGAA